MAPTQSAQFTQVYVGDETNTLVEISQYVKSTNIPRVNADANVTTFATGGGPVTENHIRGAVQAQVQIDCFFDPALLAIINRIVGSRTGSTLQVRSGNNAAPTAGDMLYQGTFTLFGIHVTYNTNAEAALALDFRPTDGGAIVPDFYIL
jgi:hypothetical protein